MRNYSSSEKSPRKPQRSRPARSKSFDSMSSSEFKRKGARPDDRYNKKRPERKETRDPLVKMKRGRQWSIDAYGGVSVPTPKGTKKQNSPAPVQVAKAADGKERLQKVLARAGIASRRNAEHYILEGSVTVNGQMVTELGTKVDPRTDKIKVNGKLIETNVEPVYLVLYKPKGVISSLADPEGRMHLGHLLENVRERVIPIGRLDFTSEGLILMTNDGDLAEKIFKKRNLRKTYMVKVKGHPTSKDLEFLEKGFYTPEGTVRFSSYGLEQNLRNKSWLRLEIVEGAKLDLRDLLNKKGLLVDTIVRTAIGKIAEKDLKPGEFKFLKKSDFESLLKSE